MKSRQQKAKEIELLKEKFETSPNIIMTNCLGMKAKEMTELRQLLRKNGLEYRIVKNRLVKVALKDKDILSELEEYLKGPLAMVFGGDDPVVAAKVLLSFCKKYKLPEIKGGILEGKRIIDVDHVKKIANLPSKEELIGKVVGQLKAPIYRFLSVLQAPQRRLLYVLKNLSEKKEG